MPPRLPSTPAYFSLSYLINVFWASRLRELARCGHLVRSLWFGAPLRIPTQGGQSEIPELPRSPFASFLLGHLAFLFRFRPFLHPRRRTRQFGFERAWW